MARVFPYKNQSRAAGDYIGRQFFRLKEAMVSAGWTVRGSGDGSSRFAFNTTESSTATAGGATTLTDGAQAWTTNIWAGGTVTILSGTGAGQTRTISSNTATQLTVSVAWATNPNATSVYSLSKTATSPGSGGSYDTWVTGNARTNSTPATAGDAGNAGAWCLLECRGATCLRQVLLQTTTGTGTGGSGWSGYGNIIYNPGITGTQTMLGLVADGNNAPGAAADDYLIAGSRDSTGSDIVGFNTAGYYSIWYDDEAGADGAKTVGMISIDTATEQTKYLIFAALDVGSTHASDQDPFVILFNTFAPGTGSGLSAFGWSEPAATVVNMGTGALAAPWSGGGDLIASTDSIAQAFAASTTGGSAYGKGRIAKSAYMISNYPRDWGDRGTDQNGLVYVELGSTGGALVPWSDEATAPLPGTNTTRDFFDVSAPAPTYYIQRVWSSGLSAWCYYTQTAINASPASTDTTPNWTGSISGHEVLGVYT